MKHLANSMTLCRILGSVILLLIPFWSAAWITVYVLCGISDMTDGTAARRTGSASNKGAVLDSIADAVFFLVCLIRVLPNAGLGDWIWIAVIVIACMKLTSLLLAFRRHLSPVSPHTVSNKLTGFFLFLLPFAIRITIPDLAAAPVCFLAAFAAAQEHHRIRKLQ